MKIFAQAVSWIFVPLLMPIYALLLTLFVPANQDYLMNLDCLYMLPVQSKWALIYMFFIFCVAAPGVSFYMLLRRKVIGSIEMETTKERNIPIVIMFLYCTVLFVMLHVGNAVILSKFIYALPLSGMLVTLTFVFLNRWKKISIHAASSGILVGFLLAYILLHEEYQLWILSLSIFISGLVISARLYLGKHSFLELIVGWFTGVFITFIVNYFY